MEEENLSFIKTAKRFRYSVNIKFDLNDFQKIDSYIPTTKNVELFKKIFDSLSKDHISRGNLLVGAYGTGKSLFATILGTLLSNKEKPEKYRTFINNISQFDNNLASRMEQELNKKDPYLLVLPSTDETSFKQNMLLSLKEALKENDLEDIFPNTYFKSVRKKLDQWESKYQETYQKFSDLLQKELGEDIEEFRGRLKNCEQASYDFFVEKYPELTSGGDFNSFYGCDLKEIYKEVSQEISKRGYQGIYVLFDEFNKLLEDNINTFNGKELQDFVEMATNNEAEGEVHLLLISHKNLVQYTAGLPQEQIDEWKKTEGRFTTLDITQYSSQIYELMSNVILKEEEVWEEFKLDNEEEFDFYHKRLNELGLYPNYTADEKRKYVVEGCYPLHPLVTALLPKLSQKIAQNERTIFTYLSTDERNTLGRFIKQDHKEEFPLIRLSSIYDYFEEVMQQEFDYTQVHQAWADSQRALQKIERGESAKREFIKSLGVIQAVNEFSELPPARKVLRFGLDYLSDDEFDNLVDELLKDKVILYRKSLDQFKFFEGSDIDFNKKIQEKKEERWNNFSAKYLLEDYFKPAPVFAKEYSDKYKIQRYFVIEYLYLDEVKEIDDWNEYLVKYNDKNYEDGIIVYLLTESETERIEAIDFIESSDQSGTDRVIFVIPKQPLKVDELLRDFDAQLLLRKNQELLEEDSLAERELNAYIEETKQLLDNKFTQFTEPHYEVAFYYYQGEKDFNIKSYRQLSARVSEICMEVFDKTPKLNNELIVKDKISGTQRSYRKNVVQQLIFGDLKERLGISGYSPDFLMYRTILRKTSLLLQVDEESEEIIFNPELSNEAADHLEADKRIDQNLKEVMGILQKLYTPKVKMKIGEVYDKLRRPPYGLRLGVLPILLVAAGRINDDFKKVVIRHNREEREINEELFEDINQHPTRFTIERFDWTTAKEKYISALEKLYDSQLEQHESDGVNRLNKLYTAMKKWYQSLPKYAKETEDLSKEYKDKLLFLRRIFTSRTSEVNQLLFNKVPQKLVGTSSIEDKEAEELIDYFKVFVKEHNLAYKNLIYKLQAEVSKLFSRQEERSCKDSLVSWYQTLGDQAKKHTYDREINSFLNLLRKLQFSKDMPEDGVLDEIGMILTGFNIEDWNDDTVEQFLERLEEIKDEVEDHETEDEDQTAGNGYEFTLVDKDGQKYERIFEEVKLNRFAKILEKKVRSSFKDMGSSVSDKEKQQILISLLKEEIFN